MSTISLTKLKNLEAQSANQVNTQQAQKSSVISKIVNVVKIIFHLIKTVFLYPFRFLGAKDWSLLGIILRFPKFVITGNSEDLFGKGFYRRAKDLSPEAAKLYVKYGAACAATYNLNTAQWTEPFGLRMVDLTKLQFQGLPRSLEVYNGYVYDPVSGLKAMLNEDNCGEVIISFGAIKTANSENKDSKSLQKKYHKQHMGNVIKSFVGVVPDIYHDANQIIEIFKNHPYFQGKKMVLGGSCYGASLASYCGLKNNLKVFAFNPLGLGPGIQTELGQKRLDKAEHLIRIVSSKNDFTSNHTIIGVFDRVISLLGIRTVGSFGKRYQIPSSYNSFQETHQYAIRHLMKHVGYDRTTKPCSVSKSDDIFNRSNPFFLSHPR